MSQREVAAWTEKDRQSTKKIKSLSAKLRAEQEEVLHAGYPSLAPLPFTPSPLSPSLPLPFLPFPFIPSLHSQVKRLKLSMQHRETQFIHDTRKKEREYNRLKERLGQVADGACVVVISGMCTVVC